MIDKIHFKDSISTKLFKMVFGLYIGIAVLLTIFHMLVDYSDSKEDIKRDLKTFYNTFQPGLEKALWTFNMEQINALLSGIVEIPVVVGIKIDDSDGTQIGAAGVIIYQEEKLVEVDRNGNPTKEVDGAVRDLFWYEDIIKHKSNISGKESHLAKVTIYSDNAIVFSKVKRGYTILIINSIIKTIALWVIFLWMSRIYLTRPFSMLTSAIGAINFDNLEKSRISVMNSSKNEFKAIENSFNRMLSNLSQAKHMSERTRQRLELLLDATREMTLAGGIQHLVMEKALHTLVQVIPVQQNTSASIYYHERLMDGEGYPGLKMPIVYSPGNPPELKKGITDIEHSFTRKNPLESKEVRNPRETFISDNILSVPCWDQDVLLGLIEVENIQQNNFTDEMRHFTNTLALSLTLTLKNIAANYDVQNKLRMDLELETAGNTQKAFLPKQIPDIPNLDLGHYYQPAHGAGGDWFGYMTEIGGFLYICIGDVTGHGISSALVGASVGTSVKIIEDFYSEKQLFFSPAHLLTSLNKRVLQAGEGKYLMTFFTLAIDLKNGMCHFANAGHNHPLLFREGKNKNLLSTGSPLGATKQWHYQEGKIQLETGDFLFLYTDGVVECVNHDGQMWGNKNLLKAIKSIPSDSASGIAEGVVQKMNEFCEGHPFTDDTTIVVCRVVEPFPEQKQKSDETVLSSSGK